jgi:MerR family transcriptional regulator, copper efflux regulator
VNLKSSEQLLIGEVADRLGLATHVLRHWEDEGLVEPERVNGRRSYGDSHIARVTMILRAKQAGLSLAQIRELLTTPRDRHAEMLEGYRAEMDEQITRIEAAKALLDHIIECHEKDFTECVEFQAVARAAAPRTASAPARTP